MEARKCGCGNDILAIKSKFCENCRLENKRERNRVNARIYRKEHGHSGKRGIHCYRCKKVKEHQERGYCLACDREVWAKRSKPDCAKCGAIKENPRDSYCHSCKNEKARVKSLQEGRRFKNKKGLKTTCSSCDQPKEENYMNDAYCRRCRMAQRKRLRLTWNDEQRFKDSVRSLTRRKIMQGELIKKPCEVCGKIKVDAHHDDYYKPLEVRWLCRRHHQEHHRNEKVSCET